MKKITLGLLLLSSLGIITLNATCPGGCPVMSQGDTSNDYQNMGYMGHQMEMDEFQQPMQMHPLFELWMTLRQKVHKLKALVKHIDEVKQRMKENKHKMQMSKEQYEKKMQLWNSFKKHIKEAAANLKEIHHMMKTHMSEMREKMEAEERPMQRKHMGPQMQRQMTPKKAQKPMAHQENEASETETSDEA